MSTAERQLYFLTRYFYDLNKITDIQAVAHWRKDAFTPQEKLQFDGLLNKLREYIETTIEKRFTEVMLQRATIAMEDAAKPKSPKNPTVVNWPGHNSNTK